MRIRCIIGIGNMQKSTKLKNEVQKCKTVKQKTLYLRDFLRRYFAYARRFRFPRRSEYRSHCKRLASHSADTYSALNAVRLPFLYTSCSARWDCPFLQGLSADFKSFSARRADLFSVSLPRRRSADSVRIKKRLPA